MLGRKRISNYFYIVPIIALVVLFIYYPIAYNIEASLYSWDGISAEREFLGAQNYVDMMSDKVFLKALANTAIFTIVTVGVGLVAGMLLAVATLGNTPIQRLCKTLMFLPVVLAPIIVANIFTWMYEMNTGLVNEALRAIGLGDLARAWLGDSKTALGAIMVAQIWQSVGWYLIMFNAALTTIPTDVLEAARVDGANKIQTFGRVIVPMVKNTTFSLIILGIIGSFKYFEFVWATTKGGPNHATELFSTYIFTNAFDFMKQGYASAISVFVIVLALIITAVQLRINLKER